MEQFKYFVPAELQEKIQSIATELELNFHVYKGNAETYGCIHIDPIEGNYRDGWIPHQHGGLSVSDFILSDIDNSRHLTEEQTEFINESYSDCWKSFCHDNDLDETIAYNDLSDEQQNELADYENEWFEPALLEFQIFVDGSEDDLQVVCRSSINYKDAPYYREKYAEDIHSVTYDYVEFMAMTETVIIDSIKVN